MKISVVIPVYNTPEEYLRKCIESIVRQEFEEYEVVIIDDGSEKVTSDICDQIKNESDKVKVIHQKNQGVAYARNNGISNSTGEYVLFVDADDWVLPGYFSQLYTYAKQNQVDAVLTNAKICFSDMQLNGSFGESTVLSEEQRLELLKTICGKNTKFNRIVGLDAPWGTLVSRKVLETNKFPVGLKRFEDLIFALDIFSTAKKIAYYHGNMYCYRMSDSSTCRSLCTDIAGQTILINDSLQKSLENNPYFSQLKKWRYVKTVMFCLTDCMAMNFLNEKNPKQFFSRYLEFKAMMMKESLNIAVQTVDIHLIPSKYQLCVRLLKLHLYFGTYFIIFLNKKIKTVKGNNSGKNYR